MTQIERLRSKKRLKEAHKEIKKFDDIEIFEFMRLIFEDDHSFTETLGEHVLDERLVFEVGRIGMG